jgi:large subunit ribosomal protein L35
MAQRTQKTHKGLKKRVKVSAGGKVTFKRSFAGHLMTGKSGRRRIRLRRKAGLTGALHVRVLRALGED